MLSLSLLSLSLFLSHWFLLLCFFFFCLFSSKHGFRCAVFFIICFAHTIHTLTHSLARSFACSHTRTLALADDHISVCVSCVPDESSVFVQFALLTKLWFLTSRVLIETLRSSVVCCARYCEVCLFLSVYLFVLIVVRSPFSVSVALLFLLRYHRLATLSSFVRSFFCVCVAYLTHHIWFSRWTDHFFFREMYTTICSA